MKFDEKLIKHIERSKNRMILVMRHGTKIELTERYDLPIYDISEKYCQDDYKSFKIANALKNNHKRSMIVYTSPFLRTKQTALRLLEYIQSKQPVFIINAFGESYDEVKKQLKSCGEKESYRVPKHITELDDCMKKMVNKTKLVCTKTKCQPEIGWYGEALQDILKSKKFSEKYNKDGDKPITNSKDYYINFKTILLDLIFKENRNKNMIIVTHGNNVKNSLNVLAPRFIPHLSLLPKTCGGVLYEEVEPGKFEIIYTNFISL